MPIYEYECKVCGHRLEAIQKFSDSPLLDCPKCSAPELRKLISAPAFRLKGGGWYETDFKSGDKRNIAGDGSSAGGSGGSGGSEGGASEAAKPAASAPSSAPSSSASSGGSDA